jgi:hypothetical protein
MHDIDTGCSLKGSPASTKVKWHGLHTFIRLDVSQLSKLWVKVCGGYSVIVKPYAYPQPEKAQPHLIYVWHGHGMQFERFHSLKMNMVAWFAHLHQVGHQPTLTSLGECLWWYWFEYEALCPSKT